MSASTKTEAQTAPETGSEGPSTGSQGSGGTEGQPTRDEAVKKAYSAATTALKEKYRDQFNADVAKRVKAAGFDWAPRPTEAEKREAALRALLAEDPTLLDRVQPQA